MNVRVEQEFFSGMLKVWLFRTSGQDNTARWRQIAQPDPESPYGIKWEEHDVFLAPPEPTFKIPMDAAQGVVDGIREAMGWNRQEDPITPAHVEAAESKGELFATRTHLEDMRRIALRDVPPLLDGSVSVTGTLDVAAS